VALIDTVCGMRLFTSDLHLGHHNIIEYCSRPFGSVDEMHDALVASWNEQVGHGDEVYILGDLALGKLDDSLQVVLLLQGHKILVPGNHDGCWRGRGKSEKQRARYESVGLEIVDRPEALEITKQRVLLSHFPTAGDVDGYVDKFSAWRPELRGEWLMHGHVHDRWRQRGREINVGIDAWGGRLVREDEIAAMIAAGEASREILPWR